MEIKNELETSRADAKWWMKTTIASFAIFLPLTAWLCWRSDQDRAAMYKLQQKLDMRKVVIDVHDPSSITVVKIYQTNSFWLTNTVLVLNSGQVYTATNPALNPIIVTPFYR